MAAFFFDSAGMQQGAPCTTRSLIPFGSPLEGFAALGCPVGLVWPLFEIALSRDLRFPGALPAGSPAQPGAPTTSRLMHSLVDRRASESHSLVDWKAADS